MDITIFTGMLGMTSAVADEAFALATASAFKAVAFAATLLKSLTTIKAGNSYGLPHTYSR